MMIFLVFYVIVVITEYSGIFFFLVFSFSFVGSVGRIMRLTVNCRFVEGAKFYSFIVKTTFFYFRNL